MQEMVWTVVLLHLDFFWFLVCLRLVGEYSRFRMHTWYGPIDLPALRVVATCYQLPELELGPCLLLPRGLLLQTESSLGTNYSSWNSGIQFELELHAVRVLFYSAPKKSGHVDEPGTLLMLTACCHLNIFDPCWSFFLVDTMHVFVVVRACVLLLHLHLASAKIPAPFQQCFAVGVIVSSSSYTLSCKGWLEGTGSAAGSNLRQTNVFTNFSDIFFTWLSVPQTATSAVPFISCGGLTPGNCVINATNAVRDIVVSKCLNKFKVTPSSTHIPPKRIFFLPSQI